MKGSLALDLALALCGRVRDFRTISLAMGTSCTDTDTFPNFAAEATRFQDT